MAIIKPAKAKFLLLQEGLKGFMDYLSSQYGYLYFKKISSSDKHVWAMRIQFYNMMKCSKGFPKKNIVKSSKLFLVLDKIMYFYRYLMMEELVILSLFKNVFHNMQRYASADRITEQHALSTFIYRYNKITTSWRQEFNFDVYDNNCKRVARFIYHNQKVLSVQYLFVQRKMRSSGTT